LQANDAAGAAALAKSIGPDEAAVHTLNGAQVNLVGGQAKVDEAVRYVATLGDQGPSAADYLEGIAYAQRVEAGEARSRCVHAPHTV
jgi:hypothetical protein